jgi:hypothetical protein
MITAAGAENCGSSKSACLFFPTTWRREPPPGARDRPVAETKNTKLTLYLMDMTHHKEFEMVARRTTDGVPTSPSFARLCLQNAVPRRSSATSFGQAEAGRNKTKLHSLWTTVRALFRGLFTPPSSEDLKTTSRVSVILTPVGLLVYQWQIDGSAAQHC